MLEREREEVRVVMEVWKEEREKQRGVVGRWWFGE